MSLRVKALVSAVVLVAVASTLWSSQQIGLYWMRFAIYLAAILLSSGMKVPMPRGESTMSVNFPFILLAVMQLSAPQALALAAISVFAQCNFRVQKVFTAVQIAFNVGNSINATAAAWFAYLALLAMHLAPAPAISLASVVFFLCNTFPVALVIGWSASRPVVDLWRSSFAWYLPFYLLGGALAALADHLSRVDGWPTSLLVVPVTYVIFRAYSGHMARLHDQEKHLAEMESLHLRTIEGLAMAIEAKDQNTHDHLLRVRVYVAEIGAALGLNELELKAVETAAMLHDIGKLAVPEHIINKPGKLTPAEFEKMKIHPSVGADILARVRFPYPVVPIVRSHHERWDGAGYPDGLAGEAIPIGARILTVVDCFDALASDRPYRRAMPLAEAMAVVKKGSGTQFDPRVVAVLEQKYVVLEEKARNEGEKLARLDTEIAVERGSAPGAGLAQDGASGTDVRMPTPIASAQASFPPKPRTLDLSGTLSQPAQLICAETGRLLRSMPGREHALAGLMIRLRTQIPFDCSMIFLRSGDFLEPQQADPASARYFSQSKVPMGDGISGWVAQSGQAIVNGNAAVETNYRRAAGATLNSAVSTPIHDSEGEIFAVVTLYSAGIDAFTRNHLRTLQALENDISSAFVYDSGGDVAGLRRQEGRSAPLPASSVQAGLGIA